MKYCKRTLLFTVAAVTYCAGAPSLAIGSNFSYSEVGLGYSETRLDGTEAAFKGPSLGASVQANQNLAFSVHGEKTSYSESSKDLDGEIETVGGSVLFPFPIGRQMDIVPHVGYEDVTVEGCTGEVCAEEKNDGAVYGVDVRTWFSPGVFGNYVNFFELNAGYKDGSITDYDSSVHVGLAAWFSPNYRVELLHNEREFQKTTGIHLSYVF